MSELPLFLLNTVLFPTMPLKLHIYEDRYKIMINECIDNHTPFGVLLIDAGAESGDALAKPHLIGCTAHITQVQRLPFGRMNIVAIGRERFRVNALHQNKPYLYGDVDYIPLKNEEPLRTRMEAQRLSVLFKKYLMTLEHEGQLNVDGSQLPGDPEALAYLAAMFLQIELDIRQNLLASSSILDLLQDLTALYYREVILLQIMIATVDVANGDTPFSLN